MESKKLIKLKKLLVISVVFLLFIVLFYNLKLGSSIKKFVVNDNNEDGEIKTNTIINVTDLSEDTSTFIKDYNNPTDVEKIEAYKRYASNRY